MATREKQKEMERKKMGQSFVLRFTTVGKLFFSFELLKYEYIILNKQYISNWLLDTAILFKYS